jgi:microcystin-dependent protein
MWSLIIGAAFAAELPLAVQGCVTDAGGAALQGAHAVTFRFTTDDDTTAGSVSQTVAFSDCTFAATIEVDEAIFAEGQATQLELTVQALPAAQAIRLGYAPLAMFARRADSADRVGSLDLDALATQAELDDAASTLGQELGDHEDRIGDLEATSAAATSTLDDLSTRMSATESSATSQGSRVTALEGTATTTTASLGALSGRVTTVEAGAGAVNPVGAVVAYVGDTPPTGYLMANGAEISTTTYPALCAVLGTKFGSAAGGNCRLPDLRDRFIKGAAADPVGSLGGSASSSHTHAVTTAVTVDAHAVTNGVLTRTQDVGIGNHTLDTSTLPSHSHTINHTHGGSSVTGSIGPDGRHQHGVASPAGHSWSTSYSNSGLASTFSFAPSAVNNSVGYGGERLYAADNFMYDSAHGHGFSLTAGGQSFSGSSGAAGSGAAITHAITQPNFSSNVSVAAHTVTNAPVTTGAASAAENRPPFAALNYIIKY